MSGDRKAKVSASYRMTNNCEAQANRRHNVVWEQNVASTFVIMGGNPAGLRRSKSWWYSQPSAADNGSATAGSLL